MTATRRNPAAFVWLALAIVAFVIAFGSLRMPAASQHARSKHREAELVSNRMGNIDPDDDDTWSNLCPDGQRYTFRQHPNGKAWDVSIDTWNGAYNVTRLVVTSRNWIMRKLEWCEG